jgi:hypothetical protein
MPSGEESKEADPCPLCREIDRVALSATRAQEGKATIDGLRKEHPHCSWCSLLIGPSHLAFECRWKGVLVCQFCYSEVSRGIIKWPRLKETKDD